MFLLHNLASFLFLLITLIITLIYSIDCQPTYLSDICGNNISANANYASNLKSLLTSLSSQASLKSFYNETSNGIYSLYLCRGDISSNTCQDCINSAIQELQQRCGSNKSDGIIWYDECMVRYSNSNMFGVMQTSPRVFMWNVMNRTTPDEPNFGALILIYTLIENVPYTDMMFGTNESASTHDGLQNRYALVQCSRDINESDCRSCLVQLTTAVTECCQAKQGWRILAPSCNLRYENYHFYRRPSLPSTPAPQPGPSNGGEGGNNTIKIVIATVLPSLAVAVFLWVFFYISYRKRRPQTEGDARSGEILLRNSGSSNHNNGDEMHYFNLTTLRSATCNFSDANKLGEGGFGPVYKGKLPNGDEIAVKRLSLMSRQGLEEFRNEVMVIVKLQHKNLVRLLGYCMDGDEKLLVYEYLANSSLDVFLFDPERSRELDWEIRANILTGTARGLRYLHEESRLKIIHRDLKASNVLLDDQMNPKISDFGTARIFGGNQLEDNTNMIVGTFGYMAPEYALEGLISPKSDVYSFGVLMIEIITGKKNRGFYDSVHAQSLLLHVWQLWNAGRGEELIDRNIVDSCPVEKALRWIHIALLCVRHEPAQRPTMSSIVLMLDSEAVHLPQPSIAPDSVVEFTTVKSDLSSTSMPRSYFLSSDQSTTSFSM